MKSLAEEIGVSFLSLGFQPKWSVADTPAVPKVCAQSYMNLAQR